MPKPREGSSISKLFHRSPKSRPARRRAGASRREVERLEDRRVMAFDLVSAYATTSDAPFYVAGQTAQTLIEAPQQVTLRFSPGVSIDTSTLSGISIMRGNGDGLGNANDAAIPRENLLFFVNDAPNQNEVVIRFAETLPDDTYRITVAGGAGGVKTTTGDTLAVVSRSFDVRLDLGAFVVSVVPQPVARSGGVLTQNRDQIVVHFNAGDPLNRASAEAVTAYRLFEIDRTTGAAVAPLAPVNPTSVAYDPATGRALLTFAAGAIADDKLYRLQVGAAEALVATPAPVAEGSDDNSSFATAQNLGTLTTGGLSVTGGIQTRPGVATPASGNVLPFPAPSGSLDEPGHRDLADEIGNDHGLPRLLPRADDATATVEYNFRSDYGVDPQGNPLFNAITENQKQRAREIFELYSRATGIQFIETADRGITVVTGDMRALDPAINTAPSGLTQITSPSPLTATVIMDATDNWGDSEYGGRWFQVAMHEIGHALGLAHSYDIPSIMGNGLTGEPVFPGDYDTIHLAQLYPAAGTDLDVYRFALPAAGRLSAETIVARPGQPAVSKLDSLLTLYGVVNGRRVVIARNDDSFGRDSFLGLDLPAGEYHLVVSSTGNDRFNPETSDTGSGGRTSGAYRLQLGFRPQSTSATTIVDTSGTQLDGDRDGEPGGAFDFWFATASAAKTVFVDKAAAAGGSGSLASPYNNLKTALDAVTAANAAAAGSRTLVRIVGNAAATPYLVGTDLAGRPLADGATFNVPAGVTAMIDEGAVFKLRATNIDVGSSSALVSRAGAALQVLGTPAKEVVFTSYHDDSIGGDSDGVGPAVSGGQWGGLVFREDSDAASKRAFVNSVSRARITYGGGQVVVDSRLDAFAPIQIESTRPTLAFNTITDSAGAAISATPNAFEESNGRVGPEIRGNRLAEYRLDGPAASRVLHQNSINGLFVKVQTPAGGSPERLDVPARLRSNDIVYVLQDNLLVAGGAGGYDGTGAGGDTARPSGRLTIDPGVVVKLQGARIELERGTSQLIAEGTPGQRVVFTSLGDSRFGAGGTFDTNGNLPDVRTAGDWGGIVLNAGSRASIDYAYLAHGGGQTPIEGTLDSFNVVETHQGDLRLAHSRLENNASGLAAGSRTGRGTNAAATIFVRGAQPVILSNDFRDNAGAVVSINANSLSDVERPDPGRSTGLIGRDARFDDNRGPLVRDNRLSYSVGTSRPAGGATLGLDVRGEEITVEGVWDDTDVVHVVRSEIVVHNFHTATGIRLVSRADASLVVKLSGATAGFTAAGYGLDITDRIGGTVQVVGQPGYPVILTSLADDTVGASLDPLGRLVRDTNTDAGASTAAAGNWRSLRFLPMSNDRNVTIYQEAEKAADGWAEANGLPTAAEVLGVLAPNFATGTNTPESAQEKSGDDARRLGFEVHGAISWQSPADVDVYAFTGFAGSEVWIDLDKTSGGLDAMVELLDAGGTVLARSADGQDAELSAGTTLAAGSLTKDDWRGGDFFSTNPRDAGMRITLPGVRGAQNQYFIRVRSQPKYDAATTKAAYEADLSDPAKVAAGVTSGAYELRVRLRQRDEKPGSTVRYADIRYPQIGIDVQGLPRNSLLTGETGENSTDANNTFGAAQNVGNLLQADHNTIGIAGAISSATDVDWYTFTLNYEQIQNIGGVNSGSKSWAAVFDLDYGDGLRGDFTISVFDATGKLIYTGRDSDVASDQPGAGQGSDLDDLSRGSLGKLDPFIGSVQMPAGSATASGDVSATGAVTVDVTKQTRYYVAVSSNRNLPSALNATFVDAATNSLIRLEPISSVQRIVEDHIGFDGYTSNAALVAPNTIPSRTGAIIDISSSIALSTHVTPFTLSDVTLFVSTSNSFYTVDAFTGGVETLVGNNIYTNGTVGDIDMRTDGRLFQYFGANNDAANNGLLREIDAGTGAILSTNGDGISDDPAGAATPWQVTGQAVDALAIGRTAVGVYANSIYYSIRDGGNSFLYRARTDGDAAVVAGQPYGRMGQMSGVGGVTGAVTGLQFRLDAFTAPLYGVSRDNKFFTVNTGSGSPAGVIDFSTELAGFGTFEGLATAPANLQNGFYAGKFIAITSQGRLVCIDPDTGTLLNNIFDTDSDGIGDSAVSLPTVGGATGLAFSPLDVNLWHPTTRRATDAGHGINDAPDLTRKTSTMQTVTDGQGVTRNFAESAGGVSMYFGLEQYTTGKTPYLNYQSQNGQYGIMDSRWQEELSANATIRNNYNLPGGAYGSLTTNSFSLAGYTYTDKPTLYFNYWLDTEGASGKVDTMRDSARVFVSTDGGATWQVIATNNSTKSAANSSDAELPNFASVSSKASNDTVIDNQHVQELFDSGSWRQARIDLGRFAGSADVRLRFDFSTSGEFDATQRRAYETTVATAVAGLPDVQVASIAGILPGMDVVAAGVVGLKVVSVDPGTNTVSLDGAVSLNAGDAIAFSGLLNGIAGLAGTTGKFGDPTRGQDNQHEGFYVDDIVVGFAERGEMVTGAVAGQTGFTDLASLGTPTVGSPTVPAQVLTGAYQLEIRRGTTFGGVTDPLGGGVAIGQTFDTNADLVPGNPGQPGGVPAGSPFAAGWVGDSNTERQQGQFLIQNNLISNASSYGISIDAGTRDPLTGAPTPGVPQFFPVVNNPVANTARLVPGVVVANNVVASSGTAGIRFSGDPNSGSVPTAAVPFGRIVNNTIWGGATPAGTGVEVSENAGPTLMNNVFANLATGVSVDASSRLDTAGNQRTVITTSAFFQVGSQVAGGATQSQPLPLTTNPFVNAAGRNFYPAARSAIVDSALNSLADRAEFVAITGPIGIPPSPVLAPDRDLFGQLRGDDPSQASAPGLGSNVFKDRGAIDRVDFTKPSVALAVPQGNGSDAVVLSGDAARGVTRFALQLNDVGAGIDRSTVTKAAFTLLRNGTQLVEGVDYVFGYLETNNLVVFEAAAVFPVGQYQIRVNQAGTGPAATNMIADLAGNALLANKSDGTTSFLITLVQPPAMPANLIATPGDGEVSLTWAAPFDGGSPITDYQIEQSTDGTTWAIVADGVSTSTSATVTGLTNGTGYTFRVAARNVNGLGLATAPSATVTPFTTASPPTITSAVAGDASAIITWTPPTTVGSGTITGYIVEHSSTLGTVNVPVGLGTTTTIPGLANGTAYTFRVRAVTSLGLGRLSAPSAAVTPRALPGLPTGATALAAGQSAYVSFTPPAATGGLPITGYVVRHTSSRGTVTVPFAGTATTLLVPGLVNGTAYTFAVAAVTAAGTGAYSAPSNPVTPGLPAAAPTRLAGTAGNGNVALRWTAPVAGGLTDYVVQVSRDGGSTWAFFADGVSTVARATVTGLANGLPHAFRVAAVVNGVVGAFSAPIAGLVPFDPTARPAAPANLRGSGSRGVYALQWDAVAANAGGAVTDYVIQYRINTPTGSVWVTAADGISAATTASLRLPSVRQGYVFRVAAANLAGIGAFSAEFILP